MDDDQADVTMQAAVQLGMVPLSPHLARILALEAEVARLIGVNAALQGVAEAIAPEPAKGGIPARALVRHAMRIGLTTEFK
jgi:hypothetical protein